MILYSHLYLMCKNVFSDNSLDLVLPENPMLIFFQLLFFYFYLFIYLWLCWVFVSA